MPTASAAQKPANPPSTMDPSKAHRVYLCDLRGATNPTIIKKFYDEVRRLYIQC